MCIRDSHNAVTEFEGAGILLTNVTAYKSFPIPFNTPPSYVTEDNWHWGYFKACNESRVLLPVTRPRLTWWGYYTRIRDNIRITAYFNTKPGDIPHRLRLDHKRMK